MEIPESIDKLTQELASDLFAARIEKAPPSTLNDVVNLLQQQIPYQDYKSFEAGTSFYKKDISTDKEFVKSICYLFLDILTKGIQASNITDNIKTEVIKAVTSTISGIIQNIDGIYKLTRFLNNENNIIDVQQISYTLLGYVIDTIKRKNNPKN